MSNLMRKHKRGILVFIILFIGVPFIFMVPGWDSLSIFGTPAGQIPENIAQVGSYPIRTVDFLEQYNLVAQSRAVNGIRPTARQLVDDGTVEIILEQLINDALYITAANERNLDFTQEYLIEQLKRLPQFQTGSGEFDARYWNLWVENNTGADWNTIYDQLRVQMNRGIFGSMILASARVFESDIRKDFEKANTKIKVKYAAIELDVELTEEEQRAHYDENLDRYMIPEERTADFIAISLKPPPPPVLDEIVSQIHAGTDFTELVGKFSEGPYKASGGDLGWISNTPLLPEHQKTLFTMDVDGVSDPIEGPRGIHIFQVIGIRDSTLAGRQDVNARQIMVIPKLDDEERQSRLERAQLLGTDAQAQGDLRTFAEAEGLEILSSGPFSPTATIIDSIDRLDAFVFRTDLSVLEEGDISEVIIGVKNLYIGQITSHAAATEKPFETVLDEVATDAEVAYKRTPEYIGAVDQYIADIQDEVATIDEINAAFPELNVEVKVSPAFGPNEFLFSSGIFWNAQSAFGAIGDAEPGQLVGPITDFSQRSFLLELVERSESEEALWTIKWPAEKDALRAQALNSAQIERQQDYYQFLYERAQNDFMIQRNDEGIALAIGLDLEPAPEAPAPAAPEENDTVLPTADSPNDEDTDPAASEEESEVEEPASAEEEPEVEEPASAEEEPEVEEPASAEEEPEPALPSGNEETETQE